MGGRRSCPHRQAVRRGEPLQFAGRIPHHDPAAHLKGRRNLILSANQALEVPGAEVVHDLPELFAALAPDEEAVVIGGESIYRQLLPFCRIARVTKSYVNYPADRFFPNLDLLPNWRLESQGEMLEENGVQFQYVDYVNLDPCPVPAEQEAI
ncbi:MAG: dihydrofolate reductase [Ruminococcaceae bacterium]|nr:dihydrofolate reductase [Oscillospiraceae bacterium]